MTQEKKAIVVLSLIIVLTTTLGVFVTLFFCEKQGCNTAIVSAVYNPNPNISDKKEMIREILADLKKQEKQQTVIPKTVIPTVIQIPEQVIRSGKNPSVAIFEYMDKMDGTLTASLQRKTKTPEDMLEKYRARKIDENLKKFIRDRDETVFYVKNGGKWEKGNVIVGYTGRGNPVWTMVNQYMIYPDPPLN
jgi:hypothetical protein